MQLRPDEVVQWGRQRNRMPSITDVEQFHEKWITWWGSCQPKWRSTKTWPYLRDNAKGEDWTRLNVTGPSGLFAVVMSTSWWATSTDSDPRRGAFNAAVEDLHWVIENLIHFNSPALVVGSGQIDTATTDHFPGHGKRDPGKRRIKPTPKVSNRP
jgi:hypothetical protein